MKNYKKISLVLSIIILSLTVGFSFAAWTDWTEPSASPPGGNVSAPINVSSTGQTKSGALTVNADFTANRLVDTSDGSYYVDPANTGYSALFAGSVGIGTTEPGSTLEVDGSFGASTVNTGNGDYELYAMDQNVRTTDSPTFAAITISGKATIDTLDPQYEIDGKTYATYGPSISGGLKKKQ